MRIEDSDNIEAELKVKATFYAGLISGAIYKAILHPIDTLKSKILVIPKLIVFYFLETSFFLRNVQFFEKITNFYIGQSKTDQRIKLIRKWNGSYK
jgi:hypothetical protein